MLDETGKPKPVPVEIRRGMPDYYVNSVNFVTSLYEFTMILGLKSAPDIDPDPIAVVRMSPQHAKVFSRLLANNVEEYEKKVGEIHIPEELKTNLKID